MNSFLVSGLIRQLVLCIFFLITMEVSANPLAAPEFTDPKVIETLKLAYQQNCSHCHSGSSPTAPRLGDKAEWSKRLEGGFNRLYRSGIYGIPNTAMQAKGGHTELSDTEVKNLVNYFLISIKPEQRAIDAALKYDAMNISDSEFIFFDQTRVGYLEKKDLQNASNYLTKFEQFDENSDGRWTESEFLKMRADLIKSQKSIKVSDELLQKNIVAALSQVKGMPPAGIRINVKNGSVILQGVVGDAVVLNHATQAVRWISGIQKLDNRLMTADMLAFD
jgi:cytochrome c5/predicted metal-dependent hydrolase